MKPNQDTAQQLNSLFRYYPADLIEAALLPLLPTANHKMDEHTGIQQLFYAELNDILQSNLAVHHQALINELPIAIENQALADAKTIIHILLPIIPMAFAFFQPGNFAHGSLTIIMDQYQYKTAEEVQGIVNFSLMEYPNISCAVHTYANMVDLMRRGNVYYNLACTAQCMIYQNPTNNKLPIPDPTKLAQNKLKAMKVFEQYTQRATNFFEGAQNFLNREEYTMAAFMLQQACEFSYKSLVLALKGKDLKTHELVALHKYALHHAPTIVGSFHPKPKKEIRLLTQLQEAYVRTRYDDNYQIESQQSMLYRDSTANLIKEIQKTFYQYMSLIADS